MNRLLVKLTACMALAACLPSCVNSDDTALPVIPKPTKEEAATALAKKPVEDLPQTLSMIYPGTDRHYCQATAYKDGILTVAHSNAREGIKVRFKVGEEVQERTIASVKRILIPKVSEASWQGDVLFCTLDSPLPDSVKRAELYSKALLDGVRVKVNHKDGSSTERVVFPMEVRRQQMYGRIPDGLNPRWSIFQYLTNTPSAPGDSGGGIFFKGKLVSILSRGEIIPKKPNDPVGLMQGPNLTHKAARSVLP